jgi:putative endonuclease
VKTYYVYLLLCADLSFYVGVTRDADQRVAQHNDGWDPDCYTHFRRPVALAKAWEFGDVRQAIDWEKQLKRWSRRKKIALIGDDWATVSKFARGADRAKRV